MPLYRGKVSIVAGRYSQPGVQCGADELRLTSPLEKGKLVETNVDSKLRNPGHVYTNLHPCSGLSVPTRFRAPPGAATNNKDE